MIKRYAIEEISQIWSAENKFKVWWQIEFLNAEALKTFKLADIKVSEFNELKKEPKISIKAIDKLELKTRHDVVAFVQHVSGQYKSGQKWIHYGLTSTDLVDTANGYMFKQANDIIRKDLEELTNELKVQAKKYKETLQIGRTHGIHAEVTSFGYKLALWYDEMNRNLERFNHAAKDIEVGKISGAVGNYSNVDLRVQDHICKKLGIESSNISTQVLQRDRHAFYFSVLSVIGATFNKIATEFRHLQRTEVNEIQESFKKGQAGSSAMPHKQNPISSENISGLSRLLNGFAVTANQNVPLWHERDISHSSNERIIFEDGTQLVSYLSRRLLRVLKGMRVNEDRMLENIDLTYGAIFSQRVMLHLINVKKVDRLKVYDYIKELAQFAYDNRVNLRELIIKDNKFDLSSKELNIIFDLKYYTKNINKVFKRLKLN